MPRILHTRIDNETERMLRQLERSLGWTSSKVVREGIKLLNELLVKNRARRIVGLGRFSSGVPDLRSRKQRLRGFGR